MKLIFFISLFAMLFCFGLVTLQVILLNKNRLLKKRTEKHFNFEKDDYSSPFLVRLLQPLTLLLSQTVEKVTPTRYKRHLKQKLSKVDHPYSTQQLLLIKFLIVGIGLSVVVVLPLIQSSLPNPIFVMLVLLGYFVPDLLINQLIKKRKADVLSELPSFIDLLSVIIGAGVSFDNSVQKICGRKTGPLYHEFKLFLQEKEVGTPKETALKNLAQRIQLADVDSLVRSLLQGEKMGISISKTIQLQAEQLRTKKRQRFQEKAAKLPVKMLLPLILFIFPPIFIIILGPAVIQMMESFINI